MSRESLAPRDGTIAGNPERANTGPSGRRGRRRLGPTIAGAVALLLAASGLQASPAFAGPNDFGLSVNNGGVTTVAAYTDQLAFETSVAPQSGVPVKPGAVTKITLDKSLKMTQLGAVPAGSGATSVWDEQSNTLTVTWGELYSGTTYSISVIATPSAVATSADTFQATAVTNGFTPADVPLVQTATSAPLTVTGSAIPATMPQPVAGGWTAPDHSYTLYPGGNAFVNPALSLVGSTKTAFRNLQVATTWGVAAGGDQPLPRSWVVDGPSMLSTDVPNRNVVQDNAAARIFAYGAFGGSIGSAQTRSSVTVPAGAAPGTYSVPFQILDDADESGATKTVVASAVLRVVVPTPAGITPTYTANRGASQVSPGQLFDWGQRLAMSAPPGPVKDFTVTLSVPEGATPRGFSGYFKSDRGNVPLKRVEYTTDAIVDDSSNWQTLPLSLSSSSGEISLGDPSTITGIRYTLADFQIDLQSNYGGVVLTLQADDTVPVPSTLALSTQSVSYLDPTVGAVTMASTADFNRTVQVVTNADAPPQVAGYEGVSTLGGKSFGQTYANGNQFTNSVRIGSDGATPFEKPYIFVVVPKGMSATGVNNSSVCSPAIWAWVQAFAECSYAVPVVYPAVSKDSGSQVLSDGSTLYYAWVTQGQLGQGVSSIQELLLSTVTYKLNAMLAGQQKVLIGMGSLSQDAFTVSSRNQGAVFAKKSLSDAGSFGSYAGVAPEIQAALSGAGVGTSNALIGERSFTVAPSTAVGSVTTIKGSEDTAGIVQGAGTATARPGGSVGYEVVVSNTGASIYKDFEFIDVLPAVGDAYTLNAGIPRGSAFDVNLSGNVRVLVNGVPSSGASVEYTTSGTPARFDVSGADVAGDAWLPYTGAATGAKALRVKLASGVEFAPGDKITLSFDGTVPASAPRDGSTAKNTVAYRFQTGAGVWTASEAPAVPVKSSAPAGDTQLSGQAFLDLNTNGVQDAGEPGLNGAGVSLQLYKMVSGSPVVVGSPVTPNTDASVDGVFSFIGLDPNVTYRVKPVSSNTNVTFPASAIDADGFLTYAQVTDATVNGTENTSQYVGSSSFKVGDEVGVKKWIKDLRLPLVAKTTVSGSLQLTNTANTPIGAGVGSAAAPFVKDYTVKLMQGTTEKGSVTTTESGVFSFTGLEGLAPGNYSLLFVAPSGAQLVGSALNNVSVFSGAVTAGADGTYALNSLQPGTGATGINIYYTDTQVPTANVPGLGSTATVGTTAYNPLTASLSGSDVGTRITSYAWRVLDASSATVASGTANAAAGVNPTVTLPTTLTDGAYSIVVSATDLVGNTSAEQSAAFSIDKTAPVLSSTSTTATYAKGSPAAPTTTQGWIDLYGISATDAGAGLPAGGGLTVDSSAVKPTKAGTYTVKFTGTDAVGNATPAYEASYVVAYVGDPTITLGANSAFYEMGASHPADDAAWKALFGGVTTAAGSGATVASVTLDASAVDFAVAGSYSVVFTATDSLGYTKTATGTLTVRDTTKPGLATTSTELSYTDGDTKITTDAGWIAAYGATATDSGSGVKSLTASAAAVDYSTAGVYNVILTAEDNAGNTQTKTVKYTVAFAGAPSITLGNDPVTYEMGSSKPGSSSDWIALFDASATTATGTTLKSLAVNSSAVDFAVPATYNVTFTATDSYDNTFAYDGTYVVRDTTAPTAKVAKASAKHAQQAPTTPWTTAEWLALFDVTATDTTGGTGIDPNGWTVTEGVDFAAAGDYLVEFVAHDRAGNVSKKVTATLTIQAPPASDTVAMNVAQNKGVVLDPLGRSRTDGTLKKLGDADLGAPSAGGTVSLDSRGGVEYTPATGFSGQETLSITVTDDLGQTGTIAYTFTVIKVGELIAGNTPEYSVLVDDKLTIPTADILRAVDVSGLSIDQVNTPGGFVGTVAMESGDVLFTTDGSEWSGDETFTVKVKDSLGQTVDVPVLLHVIPPTLVIDKANGYAGTTEVTINATGLIVGKKYAVELHSTPIALGSITADAAGAGRLTVTIPAAAEVGNHQVVILNDAKQLRGSSAFEVLAEQQIGGGTGGNPGEPGSKSSAVLSATGGSDSGLLAALAGLVLLGGCVLAFGASRRRIAAGSCDSGR